jgi:hypothetical protein
MDLMSSDGSMISVKRYFLTDESILSMNVWGNFPDSHIGVINRQDGTGASVAFGTKLLQCKIQKIFKKRFSRKVF